MDGGQKYFGNYRAEVVEHGDHGRVKLYVPGVMPSTSQFDHSLLPWAQPATPLFGGTHAGNGVFSYPNIGTIVWCFFEGGDHLKPVYFAATLGGSDAADQYSKARPMPASETQDAYVHLMNIGNCYIKISETGTIELKARGENSNYAKIILDGSGNIVLEASAQISLKAPTIIDKAADQWALETPNYNAKASLKYTVESPGVFIDASTGAIVLRGSQPQVI